jgi:uncharacterized protein with PQ loop repeat
MQNEPSEILQELRRISRCTTITAWATSILAAGFVTMIFFPQVIKQLSLDHKVSPYLIEGVVTIIAAIALLAFVVYSIYYVIARISGAKAPMTDKEIRS